MVRHHPAICQIHIFLELDGDHFRIDLDDCPYQPITNAHTVRIFVIAIYFDVVTHIVTFTLIRSAREVDVSQFCLP